MKTSLFKQIAQSVEDKLQEKGYSLGTIETTAHEFGVSYPTMWKAFKVLAEKGVITADRGRRSRIVDVKNIPAQETLQHTTVEQLCVVFREMLAQGIWKSGNIVPKISWLASENGVAPATVRVALDILQKEGRINRKGRRWICGTPRARNIRAASLHQPIVLLIILSVEKLDYMFGSPFLTRFIEVLRDEFAAVGVGLRVAGLFHAENVYLSSVPVGMDAIEVTIEQLKVDYLGTIIAVTKPAIPDLERMVKQLLRFKKPVVYLDSTCEADALFIEAGKIPQKFYRLHLDEERAVAKALGALVEKGHTTIGVHAWDYIDWSERRASIIERVALTMPNPPRIVRSVLPMEAGWGYSGTDEVSDLFNDLNLMFHAAPGQERTGKKYRQDLLAKSSSFWRMLLDSRPTAIIALNDHFAQLAYFWCQVMGIKVPHDLSIISFDNMTRSILFPLSTIDFGFSNLGFIAAHLFIGDMPPPRTKLHGAIAGPCTLIDRGSIAPPGDPGRMAKLLEG